MPGPRNAPTGGGGAYVGPLDISGGAFSCSMLRACSAATAGQRAVELCDAGRTNCKDALTNATTGALIIPSSAPDCTMSGCKPRTLYDQTGGTACGGSPCDYFQPTEALAPAFDPTCVCLVFVTGQLMTAPGSPNPGNQPLSISAVAERTSAFTSYATIAATFVGTVQLVFDQSANNVAVYSGGANAPTFGATDSAWHAVQTLVNAAGTLLNVDGSSSGALSTGTNGTAASQLTIGNATFALNGNLREVIWWASDVSSNFAALSANQKAFWSF